ncbi:BMP family ABC transporter substrate-binding protein [Actinoplanes bogorensis]|uniref:BMP family ABC transporter substrate-binding protein n=1 Tax=Paractinoplanes bogorensis TaxID=1610840 RepID=A0ABS5YJX0_9ACTN|nr:BMP family ABC transporter substrate-binding protein [Actinoplanes bogorensis]MBU2663775.1 BMP family ABC transporter substrate-binding protein [Actinoplanes bogorensis]
MRINGSRAAVASLATAALLALSACGGESLNTSASSADSSAAAGGKSVLISSQPEGDAFGDLVFSGLQKLNGETGIEVKQIAGVQPSAYEQQVRAAVQQGYNPVVVLWDDLANVVTSLAPSFPDTNFMIVDSYIDPKLANVETVVIDPTQAAYLAGIYAGNATKTGTIGFVGGAEQPVIEKYRCGYLAGAEAAKPGVKLLTSYSGSFTDPTKGQQVANSQISQGADVLMHAANKSGLGVLQAAAAAKKTGIGVDFWQGDVAAGSVPWSALKDAGTGTYTAAKNATSGNFKSGIFTWGAQEGAELFDQRDLDGLPADLKPKMQTAIDDLKAGKITLNC